MTDHTNHILAAKTVTVRWTESLAETRENVKMSVREFRGLLLEIRDEHVAEYGASLCYYKVAFLADGKSFRIDVNGQEGATDLSSAWLY